MRERSIEKSVCRYAVRRGLRERKYTSPGRRGVPDRLLWIPNTTPFPRVFYIEFKATGEEPTKLQLKEHERLRADGFTVYVCDDIEEGKQIIDWEIMAWG